MTADRDLQDTTLTHILRTGEPRRLIFPEREDVEVVEVSQEDYDKIIENRIKKLTG